MYHKKQEQNLAINNQQYIYETIKISGNV